VRGITKRSAVVAFPWQLAAVARCGLLLPARVYDHIATSARNRSLDGNTGTQAKIDR